MAGSSQDGNVMKFGGNAAASVDAYLEYKRIVGEDDGGLTFSEKEYDDYKRRVLPQRMKNRVFVAWTSPSGMDCKLIGPETPCFCGHRYKQHLTDMTDLPEHRPILLPCKQSGCKCASYYYVPLHGGQPIRCRCKHPADSHSARAPFVCRSAKAGCRCDGFRSSYACSCGFYTYEHETVVQTKEERIAAGKPVGQDIGYQAMGGLTGFSSLAEGYMRLDDSGIGAPTAEFLSQPVTASDHPFLRANLPSMNAHRGALEQDSAELAADRAEQAAAMRRPGESDMEYFERRYQQRVKEEKAAKRVASGRSAARGRGARAGQLQPTSQANQLAQQIETMNMRSDTGGRGKARRSPR